MPDTAFMNGPRLRNDPKLLELVSVRVKRPFMLDRKPVEVGALVQLQRHDAISLAALKKCEIV